MISTVTVEETRGVRSRFTGRVGFVPTMGALHQGHRSLMERARSGCDHVVVSIFVNPTQFGAGEDLEKYPRALESDLRVCAEAGVDLVWVPGVEVIYPPGAETVVEVQDLGSRFEGEARPGHFRGVATVVTKLFHVVEPDRAYFGRKDLQQLFVIERMVRDLLLPVEVVDVPTARDQNGLALSSRNQYLEEKDRAEAARIYAGLKKLRAAHAGGERRAGILEELFKEQIEPLEGARVERFDLLRPDLDGAYRKGESVEAGYCAVAVRYRGVRLIDNIELVASH